MIKMYSEERQKVIEAREDGATIAQIAVMTGVGQTTVKAWLKNAGLTARRKWKADEIQAILKEYEECRSPKAIMEKYGISKSAIQKNPAIKGWITEDKKMVGHFRLIRKILPSSNGCKLVKNGHRFVISRKYLCFQHF